MKRVIPLFIVVALSGCAGSSVKYVASSSGALANLTFNKTPSSKNIFGGKIDNTPSMTINKFNKIGCTRGVPKQRFTRAQIESKTGVKIPANEDVLITADFSKGNTTCISKRIYKFKAGISYFLQPIRTSSRCGFLIMTKGGLIPSSSLVSSKNSPDWRSECKA